MNAIEIFYFITGLIFAMSLGTIFILKRLSLGLAIFAFGWVVMVIRDLVIHAELFDIILHGATAAVFFYQARVEYHKSQKQKA